MIRNFTIKGSRSHDFFISLQTHRMLLSKACRYWYSCACEVLLHLDFLSNFTKSNFTKSWFCYTTLEPAALPKAGSVFTLEADCWKFTLIGDKLSPREKLKEDQRQHRAQ
jgi:hypothetical protein